jgi:NADPH:quinone reductase-like Zn-dependent oxidoreductase
LDSVFFEYGEAFLDGSYSDYAAVAAWRVVHVPEALPLERAAASVFHTNVNSRL